MFDEVGDGMRVFLVLGRFREEVVLLELQVSERLFTSRVVISSQE